MKALYKDQLIRAIEQNFGNGQIIFKDDHILEQVWEQLGHDWHMNDYGRWTETKYNVKWEISHK